MNLIAFGKNTVNNLLLSDFFSFKKVIILEDKINQLKSLLSLLKNKNINYEILKKDDFQKHIPDKKNQGIIAFLKEYKYFSIQEIISRSSNKKNPFFVMLDSIEDPHNFGAIIRTCSAFGVDGIIILDKNQVQLNTTVIKVSTGGASYVPICRVKSLENAVKILKVNHYSIISTSCEEDFNTTSRIELVEGAKCLVFGSEHDGVRKKILKESDQIVSLPLQNKMNSLNVSVSCGIIIYSLLNIK